MRVREPRARLRLELVAGQVLRIEGERLGEIALEVGGALAGDAVDEIERDVFKSGITKSVHGTADDFGRGRPLERREQVRREALGAQRDPVDAAREEKPG